MGCKETPRDIYSESIVTVLGIVYAHRSTPDGGELYLTPHGMKHAERLAVENWYDPQWFAKNSERLAGTSSVYRVPTKRVNGNSIELVVKNCRVGEDVPGDTQTLLEFLNAEFNSPWEEFSLTAELGEGKFGDSQILIQTQQPLAIYIPAATMQPWQSGRSRDRLMRVAARHPGIEIDVLRQYKLVYGWIPGKDLMECFELLALPRDVLINHAIRLTQKSIDTLAVKGCAVADMKPSHIIIGESDVQKLMHTLSLGGDGVRFLEQLVDAVQYSVIDYELLVRTPAHDDEVQGKRRQIYLDVQRDRFKSAPLPTYLNDAITMNVPYVFGHCESTDGRLWVVGRNGELFDYFLPERWRCTPSWMLSDTSDIFYTLTKDHIHLVWKISRVGDVPEPPTENPQAKDIITHGYNSPFEEFAIAHDLSSKGVGAVYVRAIYRTGSKKLLNAVDHSRYHSHAGLLSPDGTPILESDFNYITLRGYFNGPDDWVATHQGALCRPQNLADAVETEQITAATGDLFLDQMRNDIYNAGYDGVFLSMDDFLLAVTPDNTLLKKNDGQVDIRVCNFELIKRRS